LALAPDSGTGHLLAAYLHLVGRDTALARASFQRVLESDPYHPRALLGLARIAFEDGETDRSRRYVAVALEYYRDFPEAEALRDLLNGWTSTEAGVRAAPPPAGRGPTLPPGARDMVLIDDGAARVVAETAPARVPDLARHLAQVHHIAASALSRSGFGPLRRAFVDCDDGLTVLRVDGRALLAVTLPEPTPPSEGWEHLDRLWTDVRRG
jgi:hypothetical protein